MAGAKAMMAISRKEVGTSALAWAARMGSPLNSQGFACIASPDRTAGAEESHERRQFKEKAAMERKTDSAAMAAVFGAKDVAELTARYADWADGYDAENAAAGFRMPQLCAAFFARHVPADAAPVL